jgi:hypothetical protein
MKRKLLETTLRLAALVVVGCVMVVVVICSLLGSGSVVVGLSLWMVVSAGWW